MAKNKKGIDKKEYPKLIRVKDKKVLVNSVEEEAKYFPTEIVPEATPKFKKNTDWGSK